MNKPIFKCSDISKTFTQGKNKVEVLKGINFSLDKSSRVAIIGPSGSGKTTFLNILTGLDTPSEGKVFYNNEDLNKLDEKQKAIMRNKEIGFVYQFHHLLPEFTAIENIALPILIGGLTKNKAYAKSLDLLKRVNLENRANHKPSELSGGERQRVAVARSLSNSPACLIMDEPTGDLDSNNARLISDVILELVEEFKISLVIATHDTSLSRRMDKTFELEIN
ncbi:MAG: ATP-binding cassette domain-containing protein [SAR86 cluster bacterium]|jgi:lipoprotein-releasing system ATP-binding protein|nr:ATP-binding cassette domain-containing protein [SAR86 cluster bacterium]